MDELTIGVFMPSWLGDACMATPTLRALRESYPQARLIGVMSPLIRELLADGSSSEKPWFDEVVLFYKRRRKGRSTDPSTSVSRWQLPSILRKFSPDVALLMTNSWWSAAVARMAGIPSIVGYDRDGRKLLLSEPVPVPRDGRRLLPVSAIDYYLELARWIGCRVDSKTMRLIVTQADREMANDLWSRLEFSDACRTVVINSAAAKDASRVWPMPQVRECALRLANEDGLQVLIHCGPGEREAANQLAAQAKHPKIGSMGVMPELPVGLSRGVLAKADAVISSDSGARHMAVALDRKVVSLFGPTDPAWTKTYNRPETTLFEPLACRPCYRGNCPLLHQNCMKELSVERVVNAIRLQLGEPGHSLQRVERAA